MPCPAKCLKGSLSNMQLFLQKNELQKKIKDRTRQVMALVAEVSMKQALATKLQQEMRDKEQFLMTVSSRVDQGLPPPKETENEWFKILHNEKMQKAAAENRVKVKISHVALRPSTPCCHSSSFRKSYACSLSGCLLPNRQLQQSVEVTVQMEAGSEVEHCGFGGYNCTQAHHLAIVIKPLGENTPKGRLSFNYGFEVMDEIAIGEVLLPLTSG